MNPLTSTKTYWSILKSFLNNKIFPASRHCFIKIGTLLSIKIRLNHFFANQYSLINNSSVLPSLSFKRTENVISSIDFGSDDIVKIIHNLDPNKAYGDDMIRIRMLKICGSSIYKPLQLFSDLVLKTGNSHLNGKKLMLFQFVREAIIKLRKTTVLSGA